MRAKFLSSGLEAKTSYRGKRIPAIGDGGSRNFFLEHCGQYWRDKRFLLMASRHAASHPSAIYVDHIWDVIQLTL